MTLQTTLPMKRVLTAAILGGALLGPPASTVASPPQGILVQAEKSPRQGYAFLDPAKETAGWVTVNASPHRGFPNSPERISLDLRALPTGSYRLWVRMARWCGTPDSTPIPAARFSDSAGHSLRYEFPKDSKTPLGAWFAIHPGGMIGREGQWGWLPLFETGPIPGNYELVVAGEPGAGGSGNYKGLWVDAFRLEPMGAAAAPRLVEDETLPGQWENGYFLTPQTPRRRELSVCTSRALTASC